MSTAPGCPARTVSEAVASRRSVRAFLPREVDESLLRGVIAAAARAPSGGNLQPWHVYALKGDPLARLKAIMARRTAEAPEGEGQDGEGAEFRIYPAGLDAPYKDRRAAFGSALYGSLGIAQQDKAARLAWHHRNFQFFDAPAALFCYVDRRHGSPQWSDLGMYLMTLMLLLREQGLDSCPQECWARYAPTVDQFIGPPNTLMLFCGMSIGYADPAHPANQFPSERAGVQEFASFLGFAAA